MAGGDKVNKQSGTHSLGFGVQPGIKVLKESPALPCHGQGSLGGLQESVLRDSMVKKYNLKQHLTHLKIY